MATQIQVRRGTAAQWTTANPILADGEGGYETDTKKLKFGNGVTAYNSLPYFSGTLGALTWGTITGTLSDQTDLNSALAAKEPTITAGTTSQYYRGDKSFQTLDKTAVGLPNVDNTSDANKPVSTAQATAIAAAQAASQPLDSDLTTIAGLTPSDDDFLQRKSGAWAARTVAQVKTDLGFFADFSAMYFGTGVDGDVIISSGIVTLTRDMYYHNLTIDGTGQLAVNGYRVYVSGTLDISAASAAAIQAIGLNGGSSTGTTAGTQAASIVSNTIDTGQRGGAGVNGSNNVGTQATAVTTPSPANGGTAGSGGAGGTGNSAGGASRTAGTAANAMVASTFIRDTLRGALLLLGGGGGPGGSGAGGNGAAAGGGGGAGGSGGGAIWISARTIFRGASTAVAAFCACGGDGGNGGSPAGNDRGGGGGGGAGGGGVIYLFYGELTGATATNALDVSGGNGGNGGNAIGGTGVGGNGGGGGSGGRIFLVNLLSALASDFVGLAGTNGGAAVGITGGAGGVGDTFRANL